MLKIQEIREIIKLIDQSSIEKFTYEVDGTKLKLEKATGQQSQPVVVEQQAAPATSQAKVTALEVTEVQKVEETAQAVTTSEKKAETIDSQSTAEPDPSLHKITSPMVGTFYKASSPEAEPYVKIGDQVEPETIVCIVEAMKLFNEIEAEVTGEIVEILVEDGQLVEYGQPLFLVKEA